MYLVCTSWLAIRKHSAFSDLSDLHIFENVFWHTCRGRLLHSGVFGTNALADHVSPTLLPLAALYALCQRPQTPIVMQRLLLAAAAFPLYFCAKRVTGLPAVGALLALAYLVYPPQQALNLEGFTSIAPSVLLLMWLFYCYEARRLRWMWFVLLLSLGVKENVPLVVAGFGLYVALFRGDVKVGAGVFALATVWFFIAVKVVFPLVAGESYADRWMSEFYGDTAGSSLGEVAWLVVSQPVTVLRMALGAEQRMHLLRLFGPVCFLALGAPDVLICAVPILLQNLLASGHDVCSTLGHHHAALIAPIMYATLHGSRRLAAVVARYCRSARVASLLVSSLVLACCAASLATSKVCRLMFADTWESSLPAQPMPEPRRGIAKRFIHMIPARASVACSLNLANHLAARPELWCDLRYLPRLRELRPAWVLLDLKLGAVEGAQSAMRDLDMLAAFLAPDYECVGRDDLFVLLRRGRTLESGPRFQLTPEERNEYWLATWTRARGRHQARPRRPELLRDAAAVLLQADQAPAAVELIERGLPHVEPEAYLYVLLGMAYERYGKHDRARRAWNEALRLDPKHDLARDLLRGAHSRPAIDTSQPAPRVNHDSPPSPQGNPR